MPHPRNPRQGFALLATLALLLLAAITATLQARSQRDLRLLSRLTHDENRSGAPKEPATR